MNELGAPFKKAELIKAYTKQSQWVNDYFERIEIAEFFYSPQNVWSSAANIDHLNRSCSPVILALKIPKLILKFRFGVAKHASRSLWGVRTEYTDVALAEGGEAGGSYLPKIGEHSQDTKTTLL